MKAQKGTCHCGVVFPKYAHFAGKGGKANGDRGKGNGRSDSGKGVGKGKGKGDGKGPDGKPKRHRRLNGVELSQEDFEKQFLKELKEKHPDKLEAIESLCKTLEPEAPTKIVTNDQLAQQLTGKINRAKATVEKCCAREKTPA